MAYNLKNEKGEVVKHKEREIYVSDFVGSVKSVDMDKRVLRIIGSDETKDRDGDIIVVRGWNLANFLKNPVFLWAHDYSSIPIAAAQKVIKRKNPARMEFYERFPSEGLYPFADMILSLYAEKIINACSVGFIADKWEDLEEDPPPGAWRRGRKFVSQELLELSGCAVPANPNALQDALKGKIFSGVPGSEMLKFFEHNGIPKPERYADVLEELFKKPVLIDETRKTKIQVPAEYKAICVYEEEKEDEPEVVIEESEIIPKEDAEEKPYPNEHACRLKTPDQYERFARKNCYKKHDGKCIDYIFGIKDNKAEVQALRFKKKIWTAAAASAVCDSHEGLFEAARDDAVEDPKSLVVENMSVKDVQDLINLILAEVKKSKEEVNRDLKEIGDLVKEIKEFIQSQKSAGPVNLTLDPKQVKGAMGAILEEGFSAPKKPSTPPVQNQNSMKGVVELTKELKNLSLQLKNLERGKQ